MRNVAPSLFLTLGEFRENVQDQLGALDDRINKVELPTLDQKGELWLLESQLKIVEDNFMRKFNNLDKRLEALEKK